MELNISVNSASEVESKTSSGETQQAAEKSNDLSKNETSNQKGPVAESPGGGINALREEKIDTQEEIKHTPLKVGNTPFKIENTRVKIEQTPVKIENTPFKIEHTQAKIEHTQGKIEHTPVKIENTQLKIENTQERIELDGKMRIPAENEQFREKLSLAATLFTKKNERPGDENLLTEKKELKALLNDFVAPDKIIISPTDEVIALNDEISFIFSDENTIKNHLICGGKHGASDHKRQRQQLKDTASRLDGYRSIIDPFISISRRDYFLLFLRVRTELKFRRNKMNSPCKFVNLILFALANNSFTYDDAPAGVRISKAHIAFMTENLIKIKWIEKHNRGISRYFCLTESAIQNIKDLVEKKASAEEKTSTEMKDSVVK